MYKHQWNVAEAVSILHDLKFPVSIEFIGSAYEPSLKLLISKMNQCDPSGKYIYYSGQVAHEKLQKNIILLTFSFLLLLVKLLDKS
ncbi:hypothetical protein LEP1GSC151_0545 [Leptospira interrogans serovar Grippotyphosa str. LT2186]|uniref:Uncharacterized protein n=1 Tax=Leptospira interrogans serovar Grippotyphosa str. LT2186 TaxID=1001599 RepID=M3I6E2_LEPIR|nr:hypothetical protein LEP1GSC151_0545 [Leptospira interrogans serovar Grippotyphosa str. LT2186]